MYLTMNRFKVRKDAAAEFETVWKSRDSHLETVPGFVSFHLLKGTETEDQILFASHTVWESEEAFKAWTRSEAFRQAHKNAGGTKELYVGPPELEIFDSVLTLP
ncbi:MAG: antibiotic biosynthesis monooxygenase [Rhodobacteraceae bacterium]|nr:antibiotic biosynthesis monooxygenase [Paracoccaceae bacterium]MAY44035.1 antibiotic biosynthesis monooxygenase [Paracoccaceae bacterium]QEW18662.1 Heme-degrading monooxygenase 2 [Marinibacterium anthonyi]|tara:strand:+ start:416 stop:727 length:312 start_codon:yes stop_codon:yes gene_type:complete